MSWEEVHTATAEGFSRAATVIYVPDLKKAENGGVVLSSPINSFHLENIEGSNAGYVIVPPATKSGESIVRSIRIGK
jgi:hypothetical protein